MYRTNTRIKSIHKMEKVHFCAKCNNYTYIKLLNNEGLQCCFICDQPGVSVGHRELTTTRTTTTRPSRKRRHSNKSISSSMAKRLKKILFK